MAVSRRSGSRCSTRAGPEDRWSVFQRHSARSHPLGRAERDARRRHWASAYGLHCGTRDSSGPSRNSTLVHPWRVSRERASGRCLHCDGPGRADLETWSGAWFRSRSSASSDGGPTRRQSCVLTVQPLQSPEGISLALLEAMARVSRSSRRGGGNPLSSRTARPDGSCRLDSGHQSGRILALLRAHPRDVAGTSGARESRTIFRRANGKDYEA